MGRAAVIVLALANLGYFAWNAGALAAFDLVPADHAVGEPQRLARQIRPERMRIVTREQEQKEAEARARAQAAASAEIPPRESGTSAAPAPAATEDLPTQSSEPARTPASTP